MNKITMETGLKKTVVNKTDIYWIEKWWLVYRDGNNL